MFFKKDAGNQELIRSVTVYISDLHGQIIIAPHYINDAGIVYEQDICTLLSYPINNLQLGDEAIRNFNMFALMDKNLKDQKLTDWPAFKHSKLKTVKGFEKAFSRIEITGNNESNLINIETPLVDDGDLIIKSTISATANKEAIGKLIVKVYHKAL